MIEIVVAPAFTLNPTSLGTAFIPWPSPSTGFVVQQNTNSVSSVNWSNVTATIQNDGTTKALVVNPPTGNRFYRLVKQRTARTLAATECGGKADCPYSTTDCKSAAFPETKPADSRTKPRISVNRKISRESRCWV